MRNDMFWKVSYGNPHLTGSQRICQVFLGWRAILRSIVEVWWPERKQLPPCHSVGCLERRWAPESSSFSRKPSGALTQKQDNGHTSLHCFPPASHLLHRPRLPFLLSWHALCCRVHLNWSFPCSHTLQGVPFSWGLGRRCIQEDPLIFLEFLPKPQAPVLLFLDMFWGTWKSIQMMVQTALNTDFWVAADFYSSDCQDLSRNAQGWAVCVPWFYASTYPSVKFCVDDGRVAEHESHLTPTPQIMKWIPKKNDFAKVTERNHGLLGHLSSHPSINSFLHPLRPHIHLSTHPPIHPSIHMSPSIHPSTHPPFHSFLSTQPCCVFPVPGLV